MVYICIVCKRELDPEEDEVHIYPNRDMYCGHCYSELNRWLGQFGLSMGEEG